MNFLQNKAFRDLFICYLEYIEVDLANSLINKTKFSKNVRLLDDFRNLFSYALNPSYVEEGNFALKLQELQISIQTYKKDAENKLAIFDKINLDLELITKFIISNAEFNKQHADFYLSNRNFSNAFKDSLINKDDFKDYTSLKLNNEDEQVFVQSLLEFHNALSHLILVTCKNHLSTQDKNYRSVINHLYRATLDNYKIIIRFSLGRVQDNEDILKAFISIRENEFLLLGEDLKNKKLDFYNPVLKILEKTNILEAYKLIYEAIKAIN